MGKSVAQTPRGVLFPPVKPRGSHRGSKQRAWAKVYRARMDAGFERCRKCGYTHSLTFDHIIPASLGGTLAFTNATILCRWCNDKKADAIWSGIKSLAAEEAAGTPWSAIANALARAYDPHQKCQVCGQWERLIDGELARHPETGTPCAGGWRGFRKAPDE